MKPLEVIKNIIYEHSLLYKTDYNFQETVTVYNEG